MHLPCFFHLNTLQIWQISDFGCPGLRVCFTISLREHSTDFAMGLDMCNIINITGFQSASVYILLPTILPQNKILVIFFAFWRLYLSSAGMFGFKSSLPID